MRVSDFDYFLPSGLIAQHPLPDRSDSRMLVLDRFAGTAVHARFRDLPSFLRSGDLLVANDSRVMPARLFGTKRAGGGAVEALLVEEAEPGLWNALCRFSGRRRRGMIFDLAGGEIEAEVADIGEDGGVLLRLRHERPISDILERKGATPLPPYIKRRKGERLSEDRERYQTVYARESGSVAAPTAGLHFTEEMLRRLEQAGIRRAGVTVHVGPGTFRPVKSGNVEEHRMEEERFFVPAETAEMANDTRRGGGRVVAVGTTTVRALESVAVGRGAIEAGSGRTGLFIRPGYEFKAVDVLLTNFHLPRSTLLMLVCAFAGRETVLNAYAGAVREGYRFYSYGDCMLVV